MQARVKDQTNTLQKDVDQSVDQAGRTKAGNTAAKPMSELGNRWTDGWGGQVM